MPLPPLPIIDNCLFMDNSGWIEAIQNCYQLVENKCLKRRISAEESPALNFGGAVHLALEHRYRVYGSNPVDLAYYDAVGSLLTNFFTEHPTPEGDWRTLNWCQEVVKHYNLNYLNEPFELLLDKRDNQPMVEVPFGLPLHRYKDLLIIYTGRIDLPVSWEQQIFVMDHKTTGMLGEQFFNQQKRSAQQKGYCWAFRELTGIKPAGYVINAIRTKEPPQYVLANGINSKGKKQSPEEWWKESFVRQRFFLSDGELEEWKQNTIELIEEFFFHYERGFLPMRTESCTRYGRCPYFDVCSLYPKQDRDAFLASGLFTDNIWSPLKQPSQSKQ